VLRLPTRSLNPQVKRLITSGGTFPLSITLAGPHTHARSGFASGNPITPHDVLDFETSAYRTLHFVASHA
jgi:hypothetical protein